MAQGIDRSACLCAATARRHREFFCDFHRSTGGPEGPSIEVEAEVTSGDFLSGFLQGTRRALYENLRDSITVTITRVDARSVGALIALYERAVGLYASLPDQYQCLSSAGCRSGKKGRRDLVRAATESFLRFEKRRSAHAIGCLGGKSGRQ